jgi:hypothetical protein
MMTQRITSSLLAFCAVLALASSVPLSYASSDNTAIYTTEMTEKSQQKESREAKPAAGNSFVAAGSLKQAPQVPAAPLFSISLEPEGKATVSQSYSSPEVVTYYAQWKQSSGSVVVTFSPEDEKHAITFSRSGGKLAATGWNASDWGGKAAPTMHRDSSDPQTAVTTSGHHFFFHL